MSPGASVRSKREIQIAAPPEIVWEVLTDFDRWQDWNPEVKSMSFDGPLAPGAMFRWKAGPGTIVETEESFSGMLARILRGSLQKQLDRALEEGLEHLKREAERRVAAA
jgi:hypothetical protein